MGLQRVVRDWQTGGNGNILQKEVLSASRTQAGPQSLVIHYPWTCSRPVNSRLHWRLLDTHRQIWLSLLLGHCSFLLGPGTHKVFLCPQNSVSPVLWKFWNQIPLAFKVKFSGGSQPLCQIPRLGNLFLALERVLTKCGLLEKGTANH